MTGIPTSETPAGETGSAPQIQGLQAASAAWYFRQKEEECFMNGLHGAAAVSLEVLSVGGRSCSGAKGGPKGPPAMGYQHRSRPGTERWTLSCSHCAGGPPGCRTGRARAGTHAGYSDGAMVRLGYARSWGQMRSLSWS